MPSDPPPRKKIKTEHNASGIPHTRQRDRFNNRSKLSHQIPLAPEPIDVDDGCDDNSHTSIVSSADELNIRSASIGEAHSSKYQFNTASHDSIFRNNNPPIVPDGENTEWAKTQFSHDGSDYNPAPSGQVREKIAKIEAKTRMEDPPRIDLAVKVKAKHKMKSKDNSLFRREQLRRGEPSKAPTRKNVLLLQELYLDRKHFTGGLLEISWLSGDKISIKDDKHTIFGPFDVRTNSRSLTYQHDDDGPVVHDPVFQLKTFPKAGRHGTDVACLTAKLDCSNPDAYESRYTDLFNWLKDRVDNQETIRASARESLWEGVAREAARVSELSSTKQGAGKRRLDELREGESRRAKRSLIDDQNKSLIPVKRSTSQTSMSITPPMPSLMVSGSENQKLRQYSRQDVGDLPESVIPRRSTRRSSGITRSPAVDNDEVILVYPPGVPGAVNITNGDLARLQPGEFLNDTLIEFGLKLWLKELEQTNPTLASQIHVFNSFFYKKLNHEKKGTNSGGYESVRKWTSKFDIFQKKYIIVPINENLHWYFAIICDPEHVLVPAMSNSPSTRQQTRHSIPEPMITEESSETPTASKPASRSASETDGYEDKPITPSEAEVEQTLHDFKGSCSISNIEPGGNVTGVEGGRSPSALSYVSDDIPKRVLRPLSPTASDHERALLRHSPSPSDENMAMDLADDLPANLRNTNHPDSKMRTVDAASFYQHAPPKKDKGKRKADPEPQSIVMEIDEEDDEDGGSVLSGTSTTYIFTFDSLGSRHPAVIKKLSAYLKMEAQDKKKIMNASSAEGRSALVPEQPNSYNCGIYLLHLAETFMSDPGHYRRMILTQKQKVKGIPNEDRHIAWHDHQVSDKREDLAARIRQLSSEWKKERAAKEEAKQKEALNSRTLEVVESSDCEVDILEPITSSKAKSGGKKKAEHAPTRLRG